MIPLAVPSLIGNEKKYLEDCIDTTFVSSVGEYVNKFEKMVADATGSIGAVATSSGTTGLHVALSAAGVGYNDIVVIPTYTFIASANAVRHCGAYPWLMDISDNWCLNPSLVRRELEKNCIKKEDGIYHSETKQRVAALMPVYTLGNIPDMDAFRGIANDYNLPLIADAACAIGAKHKGQPFGSLADMSVISFNGNKTITCGGGGAVVGCNQELLDKVKHLTTTARVGKDYDYDEVGFNYRMTNIQAAVGVAQMERLRDFLDVKRRIRDYYCTSFVDLESKGVTTFPTTTGSSCWLSGIVIPKGSTSQDIKKVSMFLREKGIEARLFWKPIHLQKPYKKCIKSNITYADSLWQRVVILPCSTCITDDELKKVKEVIYMMGY